MTENVGNRNVHFANNVTEESAEFVQKRKPPIDLDAFNEVLGSPNSSIRAKKRSHFLNEDSVEKSGLEWRENESFRLRNYYNQRKLNIDVPNSPVDSGLLSPKSPYRHLD